MKKKFQKSVSQGFFGLEKESLRVNKYTLLPSVKDHPFGNNPYISRDFCEAQTEIITPVCNNTEELFQSLHGLNQYVREILAEQDELIWNHSNPPAGYDVDKIRIARFEGLEKEKEDYRRYLRKKYGLSKMLLCGIHFNFSFSEEAIEKLARITGNESLNSFSDNLYLKIAANAMKHAWLITYLTAASPSVAGDFLKYERKPGYASLRCSEKGYWNEFIPVLDYSGLNAYVDSIQSIVDEGKIYSAWELYLPVRLKPKGENILNRLREGISHIELRMLDLNPLEEDGIRKEDIDFIHLMIMMWAVQKPIRFGEDDQKRAIRNMQRAALLDETKIWIEERNGHFSSLRNAALRVLAEMDYFFETWEDPDILKLIQYQKRKILNTKERYAERVLEACANYSESQPIIV